MKDQISGITNVLHNTRQEAMKMAEQVSALNHKDMGICNYINRVKKLSMQSLDVLNEILRQLSFLANENKSYEMRERLRKQRETKDTEYRNRRRKNELFT